MINMSRTSVNMGYNYLDKDGCLVRTVCRAFTETGEPVIVYTNIQNGGYVSDIYLMNEQKFKERFSI